MTRFWINKEQVSGSSLQIYYCSSLCRRSSFLRACQGPGPGRQMWTLTDEATVTCWLTPSPGFRTSFYLASCLLSPLSLLKSLKPWAEDWPSTVPLPCPGWTSPAYPFMPRLTLILDSWFRIEGTPPLSGVWLWLDFEMTRQPSFIFFGRPDLGFLTLPTHPGCWRQFQTPKPSWLYLFIYLDVAHQLSCLEKKSCDL